jgi:hypothetical protein
MAMTRQYLVGELSVLLAHLQAAATTEAARPVTMPAFPARLTCTSVLSPSCPNRPVTTGKALLMRLGGNTLRGSNPRSSALNSSYVRSFRLGELLLPAFGGLLRGHRRHQAQFLPRC